MDRFDALMAFVAVADLKGFAPAARRLSLSPSAVTRLVAALEEQLGIRLFQRTTRSVTLTDAGSRYLERARRLLADLAEAERSAQSERIEPMGRLVVSAPLMFGRIHVSPLMAAYMARYRDVTGELLLSDRFVNLVDYGIDLAVRIGNLSDSSIVSRKVGDTRRVLIASPRYLGQFGTPRHPRDLKRHAIIQFSPLAPLMEWRFMDKGNELRVAVAPRFSTNNAEVAIGHAERNGGLAFALSYQVADAVRGGRLHIVLAKFEPPSLPIQLVYPTSRLLSVNVRAFLNLVAETCDWRFSDV